MADRGQIARHALFGDGERAIVPEFVHIERISVRSRPHDWTISPHTHPGIFQVLLLEAGSGLLATDSRHASLNPGSLVALPNGCVHAFRFAENAEGWILSVAVDLLNDPRLAPFSRAAQTPGGEAEWTRRALAGRDLGRASWLLADLDAALTGSRAGPLPDSIAARLGLMLAMVGEWLSASGNEEPSGQAHGQRSRIAARFRALAELHFRDDWTVARYASEIGVTAATLTRSCKAVLGKAPGEILLDRLLLEAMRRLTYTSSPAGEIAADLGFSDPAYFARFFKQRSGQTATSFRKARAWTSAASSRQPAGSQRGEGSDEAAREPAILTGSEPAGIEGRAG